MQTNTWIRRFLVAAIFLLAGFPVLAQSTDPVADAARKAREDKKTATAKAKKIYTEDDIPSRKASDTSDAATQAPQPAGDATGSADASGTPPGGAAATPASGLDNEVAMWRKKFGDGHA